MGYLNLRDRTKWIFLHLNKFQLTLCSNWLIIALSGYCVRRGRGLMSPQMMLSKKRGICSFMNRSSLVLFYLFIYWLIFTQSQESNCFCSWCAPTLACLFLAFFFFCCLPFLRDAGVSCCNISAVNTDKGFDRRCFEGPSAPQQTLNGSHGFCSKREY